MRKMTKLSKDLIMCQIMLKRRKSQNKFVCIMKHDWQSSATTIILQTIHEQLNEQYYCRIRTTSGRKLDARTTVAGTIFDEQLTYIYSSNKGTLGRVHFLPNIRHLYRQFLPTKICEIPFPFKHFFSTKIIKSTFLLQIWKYLANILASTNVAVLCTVTELAFYNLLRDSNCQSMILEHRKFN